MKGGGFMSVCAGIEAVSVAWAELPLGPVLYSEIADFPRQLLEQRHNAVAWENWDRWENGGVPLWGDFTDIADRLPELAERGVDLESLQILIGGTPCQAYSFAGLRGGLSDERGNLTLEYVRLANALDDFRRDRGLGPIIVAWENVEGVLSMEDNAFGCFLAGLVGSDAPLVLPRGRRRWTDAGLVIGPRRSAAWRLLDAQYFGLAQRRRRVLVVASARKDCPGEILFEREGVRRDTPPSRRSRQDVAGTLAGGARKRGGYSHDDIPLAGTLGTDLTRHATAQQARQGLLIPDTCGSLGASDGGADDNDAEAGRLIAYGGNNTAGSIELAPALMAHGTARLDFESEAFLMESVSHTLRAEGFDASEDGTGRGTPIVPVVAPPLLRRPYADNESREGLLAVEETPGLTAYRITGNDGAYDVGDVSGALGTGTDPSSHAVLAARVRRLMPVECERLQGFPDGYTAIQVRKGQHMRPAEDSPRYASLGNSMPRPMIEWLGNRIVPWLDRLAWM